MNSPSRRRMVGHAARSISGYLERVPADGFYLLSHFQILPNVPDVEGVLYHLLEFFSVSVKRDLSPSPLQSLFCGIVYTLTGLLDEDWDDGATVLFFESSSSTSVP